MFTFYCRYFGYKYSINLIVNAHPHGCSAKRVIVQKHSQISQLNHGSILLNPLEMHKKLVGLTQQVTYVFQHLQISCLVYSFGIIALDSR